MKFEKISDVASKRTCILITGESGCGKTTLMKTLPGPEERILYCSAESGYASISGSNSPMYKIDPINTWESLEEIISFIIDDNGKTFDFVFFDSLTEIVENMLVQLKRDPKLGDPKNTFLLWGRLKENVKKFLSVVKHLEHVTVIMTCLPAKEKDGILLLDTFKLPGSSKDEVKPALDVLLHYKIFKDEDGMSHRKLISSHEESVLAKDRTNKLDRYEDADLSSVIAKILGEK